VSAVAAFARRDFLIASSYRLPFVADLTWGVIDLVLYFFISEVVGPVPAADLDGAPSYFAFALVGILVSLVIGTATGEIAGRIRSEQLTGTLELLCAQPLSTGRLAAGYAAYPIAFAIVRVAFYFLVAVLFLDLATASADWAGVVLVLGASALAFFALGILAAAATVVFKRGDAVVEVAVFAMTFVSGALFPVSVLPSWAQSIGEVMPTWFAFDGLRKALFEGDGWETSAAVLAGIGIVGIPLAVRVFAAALQHAKRKGTLAEY
jgi:ABC-type polysaccharide/polyol phosphate export permease